MIDSTSSHSRRRGFAPAWLDGPLLAALAALAVMAVVAHEPADPRPRADEAGVPAPYVGSDPSLPAVSSLPSLPEAQPHVEAF